MTITELGALGEFVGSILVFLTLIYVIMQLRQSHHVMMAQTHQMRADGLKQTWQNFAESSQMAPIYTKLAEAGWRFRLPTEETREILRNLSREERLRLNAWESGLYIYSENSFFQYKQGFYDEDFFQSNLTPYARNRSTLWLALRLTQDNGRKEWVDMVERLSKEDA